MKKLLIVLVSTLLVVDVLDASELTPTAVSGSACSSSYSIAGELFRASTVQKLAFWVPMSFAGATSVACAVATSVSTIVPVVVFAVEAVGLEINTTIREIKYEHFTILADAIDYAASDGLFGFKGSFDAVVESVNKVTKKCSFNNKDNSGAALSALVMSAIKAKDAEKGALCAEDVDIQIYSDSQSNTKTTNITTYKLVLNYKDFIRTIAKKVAEGQNDNECVENIKKTGKMKIVESGSDCDEQTLN